MAAQKVYSFAMVPREIMQHVFTFVAPREITSALVFVSREWNKLANDDNVIWKTLCKSRWIKRFPRPLQQRPISRSAVKAREVLFMKLSVLLQEADDSIIIISPDQLEVLLSYIAMCMQPWHRRGFVRSSPPTTTTTTLTADEATAEPYGPTAANDESNDDDGFMRDHMVGNSLAFLCGRVHHAPHKKLSCCLEPNGRQDGSSKACARSPRVHAHL